MGDKYYRYFIKEVGGQLIAIVAIYIAGKIIEKIEQSFDAKDKQKALEWLNKFFEQK